ncbi:MAG TPA: tripartite tricarboxylate transporter substrate binding protein [Pseudolabrys sp.]|jgi:tripartite-type tricarboxylate transporter receptor subunit TctC
MRKPAGDKYVARAFAIFATVLALTSWQRSATAQDWPSRPITIVLGFASGSMIDFVARTLANDLSATLGQPVLVETRQGAGGVLASNYVAKAPPDGYTLLMTAVGPAVLRPLIDKSVTFDLDREFTPVIMLGEAPNVLVANPKLGLKSPKDLLAYGEAHGGKLSIGHSGPGTLGQLSTILFGTMSGLDVASVSYRGTGPMMIDVLGGTLDAGFPAYNPATKEGSLLAVTSAERVEFLPTVPTMKESGFDIVGGTWEGIFGPANLPPEIVAKLNAVMQAFLQKLEVRKRFGEAGFQPIGGTPAQLAQIMMQDRAKWATIIRDAKIGADDK